VTVAKHDVGLALMTRKYVSESFRVRQIYAIKFNAGIETVSNSHHIAWNGYF